MMKNKRGWLKIVEAFVSILIIMIVALTVIGKSQMKETNLDEKIYDIQTDIMREIIMNHRELVIEFEDRKINDIVDSRTPNYLSCLAETCGINDIDSCDVTLPTDVTDLGKNIYVQTIPLISSNEDEGVLTIACWI